MGIDALVVGHPGPRRVRQGDAPALAGMHQPRHSEQGIGAEDEGVDEVVVHPPVDHVHAPQPFGGAHVDEAVVDQQVAAFDEGRADFLRQEYVLVEGGVGDPGGEQGDAGVGAPSWGEFAKRLEQHLPVLLHLPHPAVPVEAAQARLDHLAVGDHVGNPGGNPQVVLEHEEAIVGAHQVGAADGDPGAVGDRYPAHLEAVLGTAAHQVSGDHALGDDAGFPVHVLEEAIQGAEALGEAGLEVPPLLRGEDAGNAVDGNDALVGFLVPVDGEGDPLVGEGAGDALLDPADLVGGKLAQGVVQGPAVAARRAVRQEHLIVDRGVEIVGVEVHGEGSSGEGDSAAVPVDHLEVSVRVAVISPLVRVHHEGELGVGVDSQLSGILADLFDLARDPDSEGAAQNEPKQDGG